MCCFFLCDNIYYHSYRLLTVFVHVTEHLQTCLAIKHVMSEYFFPFRIKLLYGVSTFFINHMYMANTFFPAIIHRRDFFVTSVFKLHPPRIAHKSCVASHYHIHVKFCKRWCSKVYSQVNNLTATNSQFKKLRVWRRKSLELHDIIYSTVFGQNTRIQTFRLSKLQSKHSHVKCSRVVTSHRHTYLLSWDFACWVDDEHGAYSPEQTWIVGVSRSVLKKSGNCQGCYDSPFIKRLYTLGW